VDSRLFNLAASIFRSRLSCLGGDAEPIAYLVVLCAAHMSGDPFAGMALLSLLSRSLRSIAERVRDAFEKCGVRAPGPDPAASGLHSALCLYVSQLLSSVADPAIREFTRLLNVYTRTRGREAEETLKRIEALASQQAQAQTADRTPH